MKLLPILFAFQSIILICQITNVSSRPQRDDGRIYGVARYQRRSRAGRLRKTYPTSSTSNSLRRDDTHPNSYYNRMPENNNVIRNQPIKNSKFKDPLSEESGKTLHHHHQNHPHHHHFHQHKRRRPNYAPQAQSSPCYYRNARSEPQGQGRFFFDLNVLNYLPGASPAPQYSDDCDDHYGGGGGLFTASQTYNRPSGFNNYLLGLAGYHPRPQKRPYRPISGGGYPGNNLGPIPGGADIPNDPVSGDSSGGNPANQNPDIYDPVYDDRPVYENQYAAGQYSQYAAQQARPPQLSTGQLVGGIANTVNGVIQTLSGNSQQGQFLRSFYRNYGK